MHARPALLNPEPDPHLESDDPKENAIILQIRDLQLQGKRTREIMNITGLTWPELRQYIEIYKLPQPTTEILAARKARTGTLALEAAERLVETMIDRAQVDNSKDMPTRFIPAAISSLVNTAQQLAGMPTTQIEVTHKVIDISKRAQQLDDIRKAAFEVASETVTDAEFEMVKNETV